MIDLLLFILDVFGQFLSFIYTIEITDKVRFGDILISVITIIILFKFYFMQGKGDNQ